MSRLRLIAMKHAAEMREKEKEAMSNKKKLPRYDCWVVEKEVTGQYGETAYASQAEMTKTAHGRYIDGVDLLAKLYKMREAACDPGETDALNSVIALLED